MSETKQTIPFESNAVRKTVEGWCCKTCGRFWGNDGGSERMAKYCCCTDRLCERCEKNRTEGKHYTRCRDCQRTERIEKFNALPSKPYDGSAVVQYDGDEYFFDQDSLLDWIADNELDAMELRLVFAECKPPKWSRSVSELLCDDLAEDDDWDTREIDKQIEAWVDAHAPKIYWPTNIAVSQDSIAELLAKENESND